jgi:hypothetical protein
MSDTLDNLLGKMRRLEKEMNAALQRTELEFDFEVRKRRVHFSTKTKTLHKTFIKRVSRFLLDSSFLTLLTAPVIWGCLIPIVFMDMVGSFYQAICFPIYGIPKVRRSDYIALDRHRLAYLNAIEKLNCDYCGYANGVLAYFSEIAARTEQYWCPIKHALRIKSVHGRYKNFFDYGDAEGYRKRIEEVRRSFKDLETEQQ